MLALGLWDFNRFGGRLGFGAFYELELVFAHLGVDCFWFPSKRLNFDAADKSPFSA